MKFPISALLLTALATQLPASAAAQLAMHAGTGELRPGFVAIALRARPVGGKDPASPVAPQVPLGVANEIQMLRTVAGPEALRPVMIACDASEMSLGQPGQAFVAGDIRIINTGSGKCPEIGKSIKDPRAMLDRTR